MGATSPMGGLMLGLDVGHKRHADRQAARADAAQDAANFGLKLGTETRLTRSAGEKQAANIMARIQSADYSPSEAPYLVTAAKEWDSAYGKLFPGTKMADRVMQTLNLAPKPQGAMPRAGAGFESSPRGTHEAALKPDPVSAMAGHADPIQYLEYQAKLESAAKDLQFQREGGRLMADGLAYIRKATGGAVDHPQTPMAILDYGAHLRSLNYPQDEIAKIEDQLNEMTGDARAAMADARSESEAFMAQVTTTTKAITKQVDEWLGGKYDGLGNLMTTVTDGYQNLRLQMHEYGANAAAAGWSLPAIETWLLQMMTDRDGNFPKPARNMGPDGEEVTVRPSPYHRALAQSPEWFVGAVHQFFNHPGTELYDWRPIWDAESKTGIMYNEATDRGYPLNKPGQPTAAPPTPSPSVPAGMGPRPLMEGEDATPFRPVDEGRGAPPAQTSARKKMLETAGDTSKYKGLPDYAPVQLQTVAADAASRHGVDPRLVMAMIDTESSWDPLAESSAGAQGLMQIMPETAKDLGLTSPNDPAENVDAGTRYIKKMMEMFGNLDDALAAYNWGPGHMGRWIGNGRRPYKTTIGAPYKTKYGKKMKTRIVDMPQETINYIKRVKERMSKIGSKDPRGDMPAELRSILQGE